MEVFRTSENAFRPMDKNSFRLYVIKNCWCITGSNRNSFFCRVSAPGLKIYRLCGCWSSCLQGNAPRALFISRSISGSTISMFSHSVLIYNLVLLSIHLYIIWHETGLLHYQFGSLIFQWMVYCCNNWTLTTFCSNISRTALWSGTEHTYFHWKIVLIN